MEGLSNANEWCLAAEVQPCACPGPAGPTPVGPAGKRPQRPSLPGTIAPATMALAAARTTAHGQGWPMGLLSWFTRTKPPADGEVNAFLVNPLLVAALPR